MKVYSFIAPSPVNNYTGNMKDFFNWLTTNKGYPASSQNLISMFTRRFGRILTMLAVYQIGTEAFTGGPAKFTVSKWSAEAN
jgi:xyloglucan-specific endo-beta-1,4-glucanase